MSILGYGRKLMDLAKRKGRYLRKLATPEPKRGIGGGRGDGRFFDGNYCTLAQAEELGVIYRRIVAEQADEEAARRAILFAAAKQAGYQSTIYEQRDAG